MKYVIEVNRKEESQLKKEAQHVGLEIEQYIKRFLFVPTELVTPKLHRKIHRARAAYRQGRVVKAGSIRELLA